MVALQRPAGEFGAGDQGRDAGATLLVVGGLVAGQPGADRSVAEFDLRRAAESPQVGDRVAAIGAAPGRRPVPDRFGRIVDPAERPPGGTGARQAVRLFDVCAGLARGREGGPPVAGCPGSRHQPEQILIGQRDMGPEVPGEFGQRVFHRQSGARHPCGRASLIPLSLCCPSGLVP
jgi:hypothetical protein